MCVGVACTGELSTEPLGYNGHRRLHSCKRPTIGCGDRNPILNEDVPGGTIRGVHMHEYRRMETNSIPVFLRQAQRKLPQKPTQNEYAA